MDGWIDGWMERKPVCKAAHRSKLWIKLVTLQMWGGNITCHQALHSMQSSNFLIDSNFVTDTYIHVVVKKKNSQYVLCYVVIMGAHDIYDNNENVNPVWKYPITFNSEKVTL